MKSNVAVRKNLLILITVLFIMAFGALFVACAPKGDNFNTPTNPNTPTNAKVSGTYVLVANDKLDESYYFIFDDGVWLDFGGGTGSYEVKGNTLTLYLDVFGEKVKHVSATVDGDDIRFTDGAKYRKTDIDGKPKELEYELATTKSIT